MNVIPVILALLYVAIGFLVKENPRLIAGYEQLLGSTNGESKLKRAGEILFYSLTVSAVFTVVFGYLGFCLDWQVLYFVSLILPQVIALIVSVNRINKL